MVVTNLEHHSNIVPWQMLCNEVGANLRVAPVDDRGDILLDEYEKLLNPRTRIVAFTQVSNALGTVTPVRDMVEMAHRHGARVLVDGAQAVSHMPVDVQALDADFYVFSGHKVFGPTGVGALYGKTTELEAMPPWQGGGSMIRDVTFEKSIFQDPPEKFEAGTGTIADAVGLGAAIDYVEQIGMANIAAYEHGLLELCAGRLAHGAGSELRRHRRASGQAPSPSCSTNGGSRMSARRSIEKASPCAPAIIAPSRSCGGSATRPPCVPPSRSTTRRRMSMRWSRALHRLSAERGQRGL